MNQKRIVLDRDLNQLIEENSRKAWEESRNCERNKGDAKAEGKKANEKTENHGSQSGMESGKLVDSERNG